MSLTLGEKLRQAREERGISISEVAEQTRISPLYIESIEKNDYKPLPGGIFNKGFVKSYAKFIGIDEHEALQDYSKIVAQTEGRDENDLRTYRPEVLTDDRSVGSMVPTIIFAGIILALMTGGILFAVNYLQNRSTNPPVAVNNSANSVSTNQPIPDANVQNVPAFDQIKVDFRATREKINVETVADGEKSTRDVVPGDPVTFTANNSLSVSYYRGFADMVELSLNGKQITPPAAPARGNIISFEIDRSNVERIWREGSLVPPSSGADPVEQPTASAPSATITPVQETLPTATASPRPAQARTPSQTPRPARTPIIVGNSTRPPSNRPE